MKKLLFLILLIGALRVQMQAQEQSIYAHYVQYPVLVNSASTGFDENHQVLLNLRNNWTGFPGAPTTYTMMYNGALTQKLGLGAGLFSEKIGSQNVMRFNLNYAFRFKLSSAKVALGLSTEFMNRSITASIYQNPLVEPGDEVLDDAINGQRIFAASPGVYLENEGKLFAGLSFPGAIRARLDQAPTTEEESTSLLQYYIFNAGYKFAVPGQNFSLVPSFAFRKLRNTPYQIDFNLKGLFLEEKLIAGVILRPSTGGSSAILIGTKWKNTLQLMYSYDLSFQRFQQYNGGSHELSVGFQFDRKQTKMPTGK